MSSRRKARDQAIMERDNEDFMLGGNLSEIPWKARTEKQITRDLFKNVNPDDLIDAYEKQLGISTKDKTPTKTQLYKCVFLSPCTSDEDRVLLQKFYNSPEKYQVLNRNDNWTPRGELNIFLEYLEYLDDEPEQDKNV